MLAYPNSIKICLYKMMIINKNLSTPFIFRGTWSITAWYPKHHVRQPGVAVPPLTNFLLLHLWLPQTFQPLGAQQASGTSIKHSSTPALSQLMTQPLQAEEKMNHQNLLFCHRWIQEPTRKLGKSPAKGHNSHSRNWLVNVTVFLIVVYVLV